jgi:hypothetical protein
VSDETIERHDFPGDLAERVMQVWDTYLDGLAHARPPLPAAAQLRSLLEVAYLAGMERE